MLRQGSLDWCLPHREVPIAPYHWIFLLAEGILMPSWWRWKQWPWSDLAVLTILSKGQVKLGLDSWAFSVQRDLFSDSQEPLSPTNSNTDGPSSQYFNHGFQLHGTEELWISFCCRLAVCSIILSPGAVATRYCAHKITVSTSYAAQCAELGASLD